MVRRVPVAALGALRHARRRARRAFGGYRTIVVPLLTRAESEHALDLACRLAVERRGRVLVLAPLTVEHELPLRADFPDRERELKEQLARARAIVESYGVAARGQVVRTRNIGRDVAAEAHERGAGLIVVGSPNNARRGHRHPFTDDVRLLLRHASCRVMVASGVR